MNDDLRLSREELAEWQPYYHAQIAAAPLVHIDSVRLSKLLAAAERANELQNLCAENERLNKACDKFSNAEIVQTDYEKLYHELIFAVAAKFKNESRHETALRYIQEAEFAVTWLETGAHRPDAPTATATPLYPTQNPGGAAAPPYPKETPL